MSEILTDQVLIDRFELFFPGTFSSIRETIGRLPTVANLGVYVPRMLEGLRETLLNDGFVEP